MIYSLAKCERLGDLEEFVATPNVAKIQAVGDRLFDEQLFQVSPTPPPDARPRLHHIHISQSRYLPGCQAAVHEHRQQRPPGVMPRAPVGVQGGCGCSAQSQQRVHVARGERGLRDQQRIQAGARVRAAHHCESRPPRNHDQAYLIVSVNCIPYDT